MVNVMISTQALVLKIIRILHSLHTTEFSRRKGFTFVWTFVEKISTRSEIHLIYDSPVLTTPFLLRLRSYRRFSRMYNTRVRFACPIYSSRDQSSSKLIIFLDSKLERSNSRIAKIDSRLDSRNFRGSRIESRVEFHNSRVTVNLPLSGTVLLFYLAHHVHSFHWRGWGEVNLSPWWPNWESWEDHWETTIFCPKSNYF